MKVLFITNIPSPYRVDFFNELGKYCELTVCFERHTASDRDGKWAASGALNFKEIYAKVKPFGAGMSKGNGIIKIIKQEKFDRLIISGYASPSVSKAIIYCRFHKIAHYIESDGGFFRKSSFVKTFIKKLLLNGAEKHFTTCEEHIKSLKFLGISEDKIYKYPFTSIKQEDIIQEVLLYKEKLELKTYLGIKEYKNIISVGSLIYRKGFDVLLKAAKGLSKDIGIYIIGGKPTEEFEKFQQEYGLTNVHFVDFMDKETLKLWYMSADCFVLPTREDIWGLVINEAMACGLPIITTDKCIAGLELIMEGKNGYIVPVEDYESLSDRIKNILMDDNVQNLMSKNSLEIIKQYTIEKMAKFHFENL